MTLDQTSPDRVILADQLFARLRTGSSLREAAAALSLSRGAARRMVAAYQLRSTLVCAEIDETIVAAPVAQTVPVEPRPRPAAPTFETREQIVSWFHGQIQAARSCEISALADARDSAIAAWDRAHPVLILRPLPIRGETEQERREREMSDEADDLTFGRPVRRGRFPGMNE